MTREEAQCKPLKEVWEEFKTMTITVNPCKYQSFEWYGWSDLFNMLREVLTERCKSIWDGDGCSSEFSIYIERSASSPKMYIKSHQGTRLDTVETAQNMSAAYAFMAWKLGQIEKGEVSE